MGIEGRSRPVGTVCLRGGECAWIIREQTNQLEASFHRIISTFTYTNHTGEVNDIDHFITIHFSAGTWHTSPTKTLSETTFTL